MIQALDARQPAAEGLGVTSNGGTAARAPEQERRPGPGRWQTRGKSAWAMPRPGRRRPRRSPRRQSCHPMGGRIGHAFLRGAEPAPVGPPLPAARGRSRQAAGLLDAAAAAPSAGNLQAYEIVVLANPMRRRGGPWPRRLLHQELFESAPTLLIFCADAERSRSSTGNAAPRSSPSRTQPSRRPMPSLPPPRSTSAPAGSGPSMRTGCARSCASRRGCGRSRHRHRPRGGAAGKTAAPIDQGPGPQIRMRDGNSMAQIRDPRRRPATRSSVRSRLRTASSRASRPGKGGRA